MIGKLQITVQLDEEFPIIYSINIYSLILTDFSSFIL